MKKQAIIKIFVTVEDDEIIGLKDLLADKIEEKFTVDFIDVEKQESLFKE